MIWAEFALAYGAFLASHALPSNPALKGRIAAKIGARGYTLLFSALSLSLLIWLIAAAARAPVIALWPQPLWGRWLVNLLMPLVFILAAHGVGMRNPFTFLNRAEGFDPANPQIAGLVRHPLLAALALWATAHLVVNGELAHAILFASFALAGWLGPRMIDRRNKRLWGAEWDRLMAMGRGSLSPARILLGLALWAAFWHAHTALIGASPLP